MKSFRGLVRRSTLGFLTLLILVFSLFVYWGIRTVLRHHVDNRLLSLGTTVAHGLEKRPDLLPPLPTDPLASPQTNSEQAQRELLEVPQSVQLLSPDGRLLWQGLGGPRHHDMSAAAIARVRGGETIYETVRVAGGAPVRRVSIPFPLHGELRSIIQAEVSLLFYEQTLAGVALLLFVVAVGTVAMAWAMSGWLAGKLLVPINVFGATAETISDAKHAGRFALDTPYDEFQQLCSSFNGMLSRLEKSAESQRRFVDYAAHEMRTPLTALQANLEVTLHKARSVEEYREALIANLEQVERLITLARELLALSRLSGDRSPVRLASLHLEPFLKELLGELTVLAEDRRILLTLDSSPVPAVLGDPHWLKQLFINLLDNAIRYTPEGGAITVSLRRQGNEVAVAVADTGFGIEAEHLPHLFERFYRTDMARDRNSGGTGLGLPIVLEIAQAHRGTIAVESDVGKGSVFTLKLPSAEF